MLRWLEGCSYNGKIARRVDVRFVREIVMRLVDLRGVGWADVGEGTRGVLPFVALSREEESLFDAHLLGFGFRL